MKKLKLTIGNKIFGGFLLLIFLFIVNAFVIFLNVNTIDDERIKSSEIIRPSKDKISDFVLMVTNAKMWTTNWVYLQTNTEDKQKLKDLHEFEYPELKEELSGLMTKWDDDSLRNQMDSVTSKFEQLIGVQKDIMEQLVTFENYEDAFTKLMAEDRIDAEILPISDSLIAELKLIKVEQETKSKEADASLETATKNLRQTTILLGVLITLVGLVGAFLLARSITRPINIIRDMVLKLGEGELPEDSNFIFNRDEIGEMATATQNLVSGLKSTTNFAENIGKGAYSADFKPLSEQDVLGNALIEMRNNLQSVADEDKIRNWATEGLAKFGELLRRNNDNIENLSNDIIANLVRYLNANQGALFIIEEEQAGGHLKLSACYAWDKRKYIDQKVEKGDGLIGQCWLEMDTIYLTDLPDDYISITSGLGDANPTSVLIVPLKVNDEIYGVIEVASFDELKEYEIDFVEKIGESIASTISSVKINAKTQKLLEESTQMTEQMRSQEEEMRQNMEELQATQEEMQRNQLESQSTIDAINHTLAKVDFNPDGVVTNANQNFLNAVGYTKDEVMDKKHRIFITEETKNSDDYGTFWTDLMEGRAKDGEFERRAKSGKSVWLRGNYTPIKNNSGEVIKVIMLAYDITGYKNALDA